jgi:PAS domain S-box-containing protein
LMVASREPSAFTRTSIQPFTNLAEIIGQAIKNLQDVEQATQRQAELQITTRVGLSIALETDLNRIYLAVHQQVLQLIGKVDFLIAIYHEKTGQIEIPYVYEGAEATSIPPFPLGEGLTSILIKNRQPLMLVEDTAHQAALLGAIVSGKPAQSWLGVPLIIGDAVLGAIIVQDTADEHRFTENDLRLLNALAPQVAIVIRNAQLIDETKKLARQYNEEHSLFDALLTNIPDRIYFKDRQSRFTRANSSLLAQLDLTEPADIIGKSDFDFFNEENAHQAYEAEQRLMETGEPIDGKLERETWPGRPVSWYLSTKAPLRNPEGQIIGLFGISRDVTDLVTSQEISERRARQLQTTAEIARDVTGELQLDELLQRAIALIKQRFGFYHASVFLLDPAGESAVLRESAGEAGRQMKLAGHKLGIGSRSMVGQATERGEPIVSNDVTLDPFYYPNPLLPQTRSELTIPLKVSAQIVGAIDVQSDQLNAFSPEDIAILRILADQLAVAVVNANLFAHSERSVVQHRLLHQITTAAASSVSVEEALFSAVQGLQVILEGAFVSILLYNPAEKAFEVKAWAGYTDQQVISSV